MKSIYSLFCKKKTNKNEIEIIQRPSYDLLKILSSLILLPLALIKKLKYCLCTRVYVLRQQNVSALSLELIWLIVRWDSLINLCTQTEPCLIHVDTKEQQPISHESDCSSLASPLTAHLSGWGRWSFFLDRLVRFSSAWNGCVHLSFPSHLSWEGQYSLSLHSWIALLI